MAGDRLLVCRPPLLTLTLGLAAIRRALLLLLGALLIALGLIALGLVRTAVPPTALCAAALCAAALGAAARSHARDEMGETLGVGRVRREATRRTLAHRGSRCARVERAVDEAEVRRSQCQGVRASLAVQADA